MYGTSKGPHNRIQLVQAELANKQKPEDPKRFKWNPDWPLHFKRALGTSWSGGESDMP